MTPFDCNHECEYCAAERCEERQFGNTTSYGLTSDEIKAREIADKLLGLANSNADLLITAALEMARWKDEQRLNIQIQEEKHRIASEKISQSVDIICFKELSYDTNRPSRPKL